MDNVGIRGNSSSAKLSLRRPCRSLSYGLRARETRIAPDDDFPSVGRELPDEQKEWAIRLLAQAVRARHGLGEE